MQLLGRGSALCCWILKFPFLHRINLRWVYGVSFSFLFTFTAAVTATAPQTNKASFATIFFFSNFLLACLPSVFRLALLAFHCFSGLFLSCLESIPPWEIATSCGFRSFSSWFQGCSSAKLLAGLTSKTPSSWPNHVSLGLGSISDLKLAHSAFQTLFRLIVSVLNCFQALVTDGTHWIVLARRIRCVATGFEKLRQ